jgi:hypothetical protein
MPQSQQIGSRPARSPSATPRACCVGRTWDGKRRDARWAPIGFDIVVPLEGAGSKLTSTINSPIQVHGVAKVPARRAPNLGEHNEEILRELGFDAKGIEGLRASGAVPKAKERAA